MTGVQTCALPILSKQKYGEELFLRWCEATCQLCYQTGFDETEKKGKFWLLNPILRNIPDFLIMYCDKYFIVNVKGSNNIKEKEFKLIPDLINCFSSDNCPLIYAFCFEDKKPIFLYAHEVMKLYLETYDKQWNDGKIYRSINLNNRI